MLVSENTDEAKILKVKTEILSKMQIDQELNDEEGSYKFQKTHFLFNRLIEGKEFNLFIREQSNYGFNLEYN